MDDRSAFESVEGIDLNSTDLVDFGTRASDVIRYYPELFPYVRMGKRLEGDFSVIYIPEESIPEVFDIIGAGNLTTYPTINGLMGRAELESSGVLAVQQQPYLALDGTGVLLGFLDTGIDYASNAFRNPDGSTRIKSIWDQSVPGDAPDGFYYGSEYSEERINEALRADNPQSVVPHVDEFGHGTFLASVAVGGAETDTLGAAPNAGLIVVKIRRAHEYHIRRAQILMHQEYAYSSNDLMLGAEYIIEKARELSMPVAICIGMGSNDASHDGNNYFDEYLSRIGDKPGVIICVAAGNEALAGHHTQGAVLRTGDTTMVEVTCGETAQYNSSIVVMLWNNQTDRLSVQVTSPVGEKTAAGPAISGTEYSSKLILERSTVSIKYFFPNPRSGSQLTVITISEPTPGIWKLAVFGEIILEGSFHAWMPITGFSDPSIRFTSPSSSSTITSPGTATGVMTVGAYSTLTTGLYPESSWGPTRLPSLAPDFVAPGENVEGIFKTGLGRMSGTSVAAAITAGICALMLQWAVVNKHYISMNTLALKAYFVRGCERDPGISYPNEQWGYGKLNIWNTFINLQ
ncbi:MAG: S8 family peptidase [Clostridiales bacterium]|nr:S8 family peptidase [Clostridiales bacterium]